MPAKDFVKRSLVLNTSVAERLDSVAESSGKSFASVVREALEHWLEHGHETPLRSGAISVVFTKEELKLIDKLCEFFSTEPSGVIKQCWKESLPRLLEAMQKHKEQIEAITKSI